MPGTLPIEGPGPGKREGFRIRVGWGGYRAGQRRVRIGSRSRVVTAGGVAVVVGSFRPASGPNAGSKVLGELARLWDQAAGRGEMLTQKRLAEEAGIPLTTVNSWSTGASLPRDLDQLVAAGHVLGRWA